MEENCLVKEVELQSEKLAAQVELKKLHLKKASMERDSSSRSPVGGIDYSWSRERDSIDQDFRIT